MGEGKCLEGVSACLLHVDRDVTETRQPFPSFCPEDFALARNKATTALELAQAAARAEPDSEVLTAFGR